MSGVDNLLIKSIDTVIRDNLSEKTLQKIESRLFEKYGLSITQSLSQFQKLDAVLREFFGAGADGLEKRILENVCSLEKSKEADHEWMHFEDQYLTKIILEALGDEDKKQILIAVMDESHIISEILDICNIPQTSGYRKVNSLIENGLLINSGYITTSDGKKVTKYIALFKNVKIDIIKNKITVKAKIGKDVLNNSTLVPLIQTV